EMTPFDEYIEKNKYPDTFLKKGELKDGVAKLYYFSNYEEYNKYNEETSSSLSNKHFDDWSTSRKNEYSKNVLESISTTLDILQNFDDVERVQIELPVDGDMYVINITDNEMKKFVMEHIERIRIGTTARTNFGKLKEMYEMKDPGFFGYLNTIIKLIHKPYFDPFMSVK
ncbi:hypothetical protein IC620_16730, partial [Hazenella sp. IB182357]